MNEKVYCEAYFYSSSPDLVEEFCEAKIHPLVENFVFPWSKLIMAMFDVDGIWGPIFCLLVDLAVRMKGKKRIERYVRRIEEAATWYCGGYSTFEHKQVFERMATHGCFNHILCYAGIAYPPRDAPRETEALSKK